MQLVGELIEERLLSLDEVIDQVNTPEAREKLVATITGNTVARRMLPRFILAGLYS